MITAADTRSRILAAALDTASLDGLNGLSLAPLAERLGLSKTGVVLPFGSKSALQMAVLDVAMTRFLACVFQPSLAAPRGLPRLDRLMQLWLDWLDEADGLPGGCPLIPATREWDDQDGPLQHKLRAGYRQWGETLAEMLRRAEGQGHLRPGLDRAQIVFGLYGIILQAQHSLRLLRQPDWRRRAEQAYADLLARHRLT